jgi:hypothetical protein
MEFMNCKKNHIYIKIIRQNHVNNFFKMDFVIMDKGANTCIQKLNTCHHKNKFRQINQLK